MHSSVLSKSPSSHASPRLCTPSPHSPGTRPVVLSSAPEEAVVPSLGVELWVSGPSVWDALVSMPVAEVSLPSVPAVPEGVDGDVSWPSVAVAEAEDPWVASVGACVSVADGVVAASLASAAEPEPSFEQPAVSVNARHRVFGEFTGAIVANAAARRKRRNGGIAAPVPRASRDSLARVSHLVVGERTIPIVDARLNLTPGQENFTLDLETTGDGVSKRISIFGYCVPVAGETLAGCSLEPAVEDPADIFNLVVGGVTRDIAPVTMAGEGVVLAVEVVDAARVIVRYRGNFTLLELADEDNAPIAVELHADARWSRE